MMEGLKKRTRKAFGIRKKEKDTDSTGSPDRDGIQGKKKTQKTQLLLTSCFWLRALSLTLSQKKSNGAPNGFYAEIDWERYNSPELDEEGYSIRPEEPGSTKGKHFYSSSESEEEEESHKKFNIKIKPLQSKDILKNTATVDELKASIGNIALSPSPVRKSPRRSPGAIKRNLSSEEVARPRRSTPTPELISKKPPDDTTALAPLFGPPLESAFDEQKTEVLLDQPEIWGSGQPINPSIESPKLTRPFPTGTPPPLPPKNIPATPPRTSSPLTVGPGNDQSATEVKIEKLPSINDLDSIFGPVLSPKSVAVTAEEKWVHFSDTSPEHVPSELTPREKVVTPPAASDNPADSPALSPPSPPGPPGPPPGPPGPPRNVPSPLNLEEVQKKAAEQTFIKDDYLETVSSPKDLGLGQRATPPPPPPPTYRTVVSSPGPGSGSGTGTTSGASSPARPATPLGPSSSTTPPPPPPRPPSRPKLPPGKPGVGDVPRPFSPPIHSSSPPPIAPLARAESTSSISSTNSLSAATTPTVVSEDDVFYDKLPSFERRCETPAENEQPSLVWFDRGKFYLTFEGSSRGPSPLTMGAQDTLPVAAAFTETVNAYFKGADPSKCIVKITGEMVLSFPAGITRHFANNPSPAALTFRVINFSRLEHVLPNPQLLCCDNSQNDANSKEFWVNMPNLMTHLKKVSEQKPQATYYNVDMLKYQVSAQGIQSTPLNLAVNWRCEPASTDLRIDYKYNTDAMTTAVALNNVQFLVPIDGGVTKLQAVLPPAVWNAEQQRILWKIPDISQKSENGGVGSLLARFQLSEGPSKPSPLVVQFTSEGSTLSGCDIELVGAGYRFSLIKKRFAAGKYLADN
ncbi:PREDICTED: SH3-containing GRB2-like protein 3-interacting protein 1 isoform X1 [Hipposideros armiger]|uniref:SH3-containing GRB2-like protein 3-interacting protein 1 n=1 Tax=Hipposideros armiger TaxID=186990 RepID=A0A8B7RMG6_HIPAR|nr:PREDICTED: SH3-containing GRB2-like protein 3-interacting protein 1 isoform X1 [Hipposideros armiger]XP_019502279.1 PREDICTED: SH3-containing GRB2-like protein 3-interacting protein 1 isoform X1 [Hipposideros armiger]XP_019502280.1 PREDICTED: SH3-containing GRB2-like protein 3-interacting protein 1 isoform X1 [Hipposideros armiger]XP_019502281.1 PREDICTED: SH3-containing GRB2-like protein 3-interacting protein 1 isoform X1 [Hipposideros armiger]XP_019502282.1 PREDICTED: SH3-containing GRB2-l